MGRLSWEGNIFLKAANHDEPDHVPLIFSDTMLPETYPGLGCG